MEMEFTITRREFAKLVTSTMLDKLEEKLFDNDYTVKTDSFIIHYDVDFEQLYILSRFDLQAVSWYKFSHVGRALEIVNFNNKEELKDFMKLLEKELLEDS